MYGLQLASHRILAALVLVAALASACSTPGIVVHDPTSTLSEPETLDLSGINNCSQDVPATFTHTEKREITYESSGSLGTNLGVVEAQIAAKVGGSEGTENTVQFTVPGHTHLNFQKVIQWRVYTGEVTRGNAHLTFYTVRRPDKIELVPVRIDDCPITPTPPPKEVVRHLGTCKFGTFEQELINGVGIYTGEQDSYYLDLLQGVQLASGGAFNSPALAEILNQNKDRLVPVGYVRSEPAGEYRLRVITTGKDVTYDPKQAFLCELSKIEIPTLGK
jgi:hypothetical protein